MDFGKPEQLLPDLAALQQPVGHQLVEKGIHQLVAPSGQFSVIGADRPLADELKQRGPAGAFTGEQGSGDGLPADGGLQKDFLPLG